MSDNTEFDVGMTNDQAPEKGPDMNENAKPAFAGTSEVPCSDCAKWANDNFLLHNALGSAIWYIREMHAKGFLTGGKPFMNDLETVYRNNGQGC